MKVSVASVVALLGVITFTYPVFAADAPQPNYGPEIRYNPDQRFAMPVNKATGLNNAKNVVIKDVTLSAVPEFIRIQAETLAETCAKDKDNTKLMKFYRYTSDATRDNQVSASYLIDLGGLTEAKQQVPCVVGNACTKDGCMLIGYGSTAFEKWSQSFMFRQKSWDHKNVNDDKAKATLKVFELMVKCKGADADKKDDKGCMARRVWLESGFVEYRPGNMLDNVTPFTEPEPEEVPDAAPGPTPNDLDDVPAPSATPTSPPTSPTVAPPAAPDVPAEPPAE